MYSDEPKIVKEFRELYDYVRLLGKHVNQVYSRLDKIEQTINELSSTHGDSIKESATQISIIQENMVNKNEFSEFIEKLKSSISETLPPLPAETLKQTQETSSVSSSPEEQE